MMEFKNIDNDVFNDVLLSSIRPHPKLNFILNPKVCDLIRRAMQKEGFKGYLMVEKKSRFIIAGYAQYHVAQELGIRTVSVMEIELESPLIKAYLEAYHLTKEDFDDWIECP